MDRFDTHEVCFDQALIERYGGRGPRYTSYPTALQFHEGFSADDYRRHAVRSNASGRPLSLYVHIPFCSSLCYYCACNKIVTRNAERIEKYLRHLDREIDLQAKLFDSRRKIEQLHFGGGTPTYLSERQLRALMAHLRKAFHFDESDRHEFSIEVDPRSVNSRMMGILAELGFNRLSLGIQDFDPQVQHAVNRIQSTDDVSQLMHDARRNRFRSVSFDLIYGLPHQTVETFDITLDKTLEMRPDRLAIYNYAHLPARFKGQRMIDDTAIPLPGTKLEILHHTIDKLAKSEYVYIGMDHFALPDDDLVRAQDEGSLQRNFQGYSTHRECDLISLGVSAIGSIGNIYAQNTTSTSEYEAILESGRLPICKGIEVDADDLLRAEVISQLMCYDRLVFTEFDAAHNVQFLDYFRREVGELQPVIEDGLVSIDNTQIVITPKGRLLLRSIAMVFDRYIGAEQHDSRFSKAI
ncbi:MAG: oxygen-independent coproporphyrinogen III oxidase [Woeseiaceae bacterium]